MTVRRWHWWAFGTALYALYALATVPAHVAHRLLPTTNALVLAGLQGTAWNGRAAVGSVQGIALSDVEWQMSPWALFLGQLRGAAGARLTDGFIETEFAATPTTLRLSNLRASTNLAVLAQSDILNLLGALGGQASLMLERFAWRHDRVTDIDGELRLRELAVPSLLQPGNAALIPLGSYRVELGRAEADGLVAAFHDDSGPLEVTGHASLDAALAYQLDARIRPRPDAAPELLQGLALMASPPDTEGFRQLSLNGSL